MSLSMARHGIGPTRAGSLLSSSVCLLGLAPSRSFSPTPIISRSIGPKPHSLFPKWRHPPAATDCVGVPVHEQHDEQKERDDQSGTSQFFWCGDTHYGCRAARPDQRNKGWLNRCQVFLARRKLGCASGICSAKTD